EAAAISDEIEDVAKVGDDAGNGIDEDQRLDKTDAGREQPPLAGDEHDADRPHGIINHAQHKNRQRKQERFRRHTSRNLPGDTSTVAGTRLAVDLVRSVTTRGYSSMIQEPDVTTSLSSLRRENAL